MADSIHMYLSAFRESMLTAVARLEFQLRDVAPALKSREDKDSSTEMANIKASLEKQEMKLNELIEQIKNIPVVSSEPVKNEIEELLKIKETSPKNPIVEVGDSEEEEEKDSDKESQSSDEEMSDSDGESEEESSESEEESSESEEEVEEPEIKEPGDDCGATKSECDEEDESPPSLLEFEVDGKIFYRDEDNTVYQKVGEDEYEEIGEWDPNEEAIIILEEENEAEKKVEEKVEEEEVEEGLECEEFTYKGKSYLRDVENYVYTEDGEQIGIWDGKKIFFTP